MESCRFRSPRNPFRAPSAGRTARFDADSAQLRRSRAGVGAPMEAGIGGDTPRGALALSARAAGPGGAGGRARPRAPSTLPPVRIFLGTEEAQYRAERIFFWSIEKFRDPARTYEIHLMNNVAGFDRKGWRTGFTKYRFAIPDFAGRQGKAIYNDVDQIYLGRSGRCCSTSTWAATAIWRSPPRRPR